MNADTLQGIWKRQIYFRSTFETRWRSREERAAGVVWPTFLQSADLKLQEAGVMPDGAALASGPRIFRRLEQRERIRLLEGLSPREFTTSTIPVPPQAAEIGR